MVTEAWEQGWACDPLLKAQPFPSQKILEIRFFFSFLAILNTTGTIHSFCLNTNQAKSSGILTAAAAGDLLYGLT